MRRRPRALCYIYVYGRKAPGRGRRNPKMSEFDGKCARRGMASSASMRMGFLSYNYGIRTADLRAIVAVRTRQYIRCSFVIPRTAIVAIRTRECPKEVSLSKRRKGHIFVY